MLAPCKTRVQRQSVLGAGIHLHCRKSNVSLFSCRALKSSEDLSATPIVLSDNALAHLRKLKAEKADDSLLLRVGVRSGGCSGLSYAMDFEEEGNIGEDDSVMEYKDVKLVCDPKSLLYLFGMELDYSSALVGGGFKFNNPNADSTCGCGKSFGV